MAKLSERKSDAAVKLMLIGDSGAGKTGALTPLVAAGYKLKIIDMDNGLDALYNHVRAECPDKIDNIDYQTFRDKMTVGPTGPVVKGAAKAAVNAIKALDKWDDGTEPSTWGLDTILVLDSLTAFGMACYNWARGMNPSSKEKRQWYMAGQELVESTIASLTAEEFNVNVIVISHVDIREQEDGTVRGFASSLGKSLGPKLPRYFNTLVLSETRQVGPNTKRTLHTVPTSLIALKTPAPMRIEKQYPLETGLATIFEKLKTQ